MVKIDNYKERSSRSFKAKMKGVSTGRIVTMVSCYIKEFKRNLAFV